MVKIIKSIAKSIGHGIKHDPEVTRIKNKYPKTFTFFRRRFTKEHKYGLYLTIGIIFTLFFVYLFFGILRDYIGQENLVQFDLRVLNLFKFLRTEKLNYQALFVTYLAKGEVITVGVIILSLILILQKNWRFLNALLISVLGGELFVWIIKNTIDRPRPPLINALVTETSYSFPSGHTFVSIAFYGLLVYFIIQSEKNKFLKIISFIIGIFIIFLVGLSRIYLGAHWPSDVLASFAAGAAWLSVIITSLKIRKEFTPPKKIDFKFKKITIFVSSLFLILVWFIFIVGFYITHPLQIKKEQPTPKEYLKKTEINNKLFENLPKISETMTGLPAEPINIIIVGNKDTINYVFTQSGWYLLDGPSIKSYNKIITSLIGKKSYPQTPGLPVFWNTQPSEFAYGKPTNPNSISAREHIHFWETNFVTPDGQDIWVGTAHFDEEIQKKLGIIMPYHTTELRVDNEREKIKSELETNGFINFSEKIDLTGLLYGTKKSSGNSFLTDGQAYIIYLKDFIMYQNEKR